MNLRTFILKGDIHVDMTPSDTKLILYIYSQSDGPEVLFLSYVLCEQYFFKIMLEQYLGVQRSKQF